MPTLLKAENSSSVIRDNGKPRTTSDNPKSAFMYAFRVTDSRRQYPGRFKVYLVYLGF